MTDNTRALPPLSDARIDEIEDALFAGIARERDRERAVAAKRSARRGRVWGGGLAAAGVIAVAAVIGPSLGVMSTAGGAADEAFAPAVGMPAPESAPFSAESMSSARDGSADLTKGGTADLGTSGAADSALDAPAAGRDVITTASATVEVDDVVAAAAAVSAAAAAEGGFVESQSLDASADPSRVTEGDIAYYPGPSGSWISVRVPADRLDAVVASLADLGTVTSSRVDRQDVTTQTIDLRARIDALEASVERLTGLMAEATTTADLLTAESELSARQGELESYRQQLSYLEGQVQLSTLSVSLVEPTPVVKADPAGFGDGIAAGWNGLVATLNGIVIGLGFLLPWLAVLAVVLLATWGVRRLVRRRRASGAEPRDGDGTASSVD